VLDAIRERKAPFSPEGVVEEFAALIKSYRCSKLSGDKYAGEWPQDLLHTMRKGEVGIVSRLATLSSIPAQSIFWNDRLVMQLTSLERRTSRGGRDSIDHAPGAHDDVLNAVAGALVTAYKEPGVKNFNRRLVLPDLGRF
jgi:hypothetical protein